MAIATVVGADGSTITVSFATQAYASLAQSLAGSMVFSDFEDAGGYTITSPDDVISAPSGSFQDDLTATGQEILIGSPGGAPVAASFSTSAGGGTIIAGNGMDTFNLAGGDWTVLTGADPSVVLTGTGNNVIGMGGPDTVLAGSGDTTVFGAAGSEVVMGSGNLLDVAGSGSESVVGSAAGFATVFGTAGTDLTFTGGGDNNLLIAGGGNETLNAAGSSGSNVFVGGTGADSIVGGSGDNVFIASSGSDTFTGGAGSSLFIFTDEPTTSTDVITDFSSADKLAFYGVDYTVGSDAAGDVQLTLSDGLKIDFTGLTTFDPSQVIT